MKPSAPATVASPLAERNRPSVFRGPLLNALAEMPHGCLRVELPGGLVREFGDQARAAARQLPTGIPAMAHVCVRREAFFRKCVLGGDIGFAESFIDGDWETPNLTALVAWFIHNVEWAPTLSGSGRARSLALNFLRFANRLGHLLRSNSKDRAQRNISAHYDLSNDFFALFLDSSMMYSAAKWTTPALTLAEAQREKNAALCRKLQLGPDDHVLEIGSGWGGWSIQAARTHGCRVTTVTISEQQLELARARVREAGLADRVEVKFCDYRDLEGRFDKIVSIEMMEAIGHGYLPDFARSLHRLLKPNGIVALQYITCPDNRYEQFRRGVDFIQKHVFPGSLLLSVNRVCSLLSDAGGFVLHGLEDLGQDYARTLRHWHENFRQRSAQIAALGFDERFIRKWTYYLSYCEAAFAMRNISVVQAVYTRANNLAL